MQAIVVVPGSDGPTLRMQTVPEPQAGPDDLRIAVKAAGLNRADLARVQQHYAGGAFHIAGLEAAGEVIAVGANVTGFRPGDRVMAMCRDAYAEQVVVDHRTALRVPDGTSWSEAAALPTWLLTAHDAIVANGRLAPGEAVLVQGAASGVGVMAIQVAKAKGAGLVLGTSRDARKLDRLAREFGLDVPIDVSSGDVAEAARAATQDRGVDVIIDHVGGSALKGNMAAAAIGARIVGVGRLGGKLAEIDLDLLALKRITLVGVTFRTRTIEEKAEVGRRAMADLWPLIEEGRLKPVVDRSFPLEAALEAQDYMRLNAHLGKIVLTLN